MKNIKEITIRFEEPISEEYKTYLLDKINMYCSQSATISETEELDSDLENNELEIKEYSNNCETDPSSLAKTKQGIKFNFIEQKFEEAE